MDLSCIILSGDLELYVLGMLPQDEAYKIEQLAILFPEVQEELDRISASLLHLASDATLTPSPSVKDSLMQQLQSMKEAEQTLDTPVLPIQTGRNLPDVQVQENSPTQAPVIQMRTERSGKLWLSAAAFIGFILSLGVIVFLVSKNKEYRSEIASLDQSVRTLNRNVVELQRENLASAQMVDMLQSEAYKKIRLTSVPGKPDALAQVLWNTQTKEVFVNNISLPEAPSGKQYQLWAIVDGKPVDAGVLHDDKNKVQKMKTFDRADAFAITLEREGGSPSPTLEAMYVMAKV